LIVKYLIKEQGADLNALNDENYTLHHLAADWDQINIVKYLVEEK